MPDTTQWLSTADDGGIANAERRDFDDGRRPWWRRKRVLLPTGVLFLAVVAAAVSDDVEPTEPTETAGGSVEAEGGDVDDQIDRFAADPQEQDVATSSSNVSSSTTSSSSATSTTQGSTTTTTSTTATTGPPPSEATTTPQTVAVSSSSTTVATTQLPTTTSTAPPSTTAPTTTTTQPPTTAASGCHPAYSPCLPNHPGDALNCGHLSSGQKPVTVHNVNVDPYGLDADNDGVGCESG